MKLELLKSIIKDCLQIEWVVWLRKTNHLLDKDEVVHGLQVAYSNGWNDAVAVREEKITMILERAMRDKAQAKERFDRVEQINKTHPYVKGTTVIFKAAATNTGLDNIPIKLSPVVPPSEAIMADIRDGKPVTVRIIGIDPGAPEGDKTVRAIYQVGEKND